MADNMLKAGFKGITWDSTYDAWTPARAYSHYHGGVRILSETASVNLATPINVKPEQLRAGEGYDARKATPNFPVLWPGGEWHLRDITSYMTTAAFELLKHAAQNRDAWLKRFYAIGKEAVRPRRRGELQGFSIPLTNNSAALLAILRRGGVEVSLVERPPMRNGRPSVVAPNYYVPLAQPYGAFAKALLEAQHYPDLRDAEGHPIAPYDVTAHTLPLLMDAPAEPVYRPATRVKPARGARVWRSTSRTSLRWTRVGRAGCLPTVTSTTPRSRTKRYGAGTCARSSTPSSFPTTRRARFSTATGRARCRRS